MKYGKAVSGTILALTLSVTAAWAQAAPAQSSDTTQTFYLTNALTEKDSSELVTALRNMLDAKDKVFLVPSQKAIVLRGSPEQIALAQKLLKELDRPKKAYRLTYNITEMDGERRIGVQRFAMIVAEGGKTALKEGSKVPISVASFDGGSGTHNAQMTYVDVGLNIDATLDEFVDGVRLRSKVEQSSIVDEKSNVQDPVIRQAVLEGTSILAPGKALALGSLDVPGSTRHINIEVVMDVVR